MKKTLINLLSIVLVFCLAACGSGSNHTESKEQSSAFKDDSSSAVASEDSEQSSMDAIEDASEESSEEASEEASEATSEESSEDSEEESADDSSEESAEAAVGKTLTFKAKYVKTGYDSSKTQPYAVTIDSSADLTSYYLTNKSVCGLGTEYKKAISDYDVDFFESKTLVMVAMTAENDTASHEVTKVVLIDYDGNKWLNIEITRSGASIGKTGRHIIIELDKECLEAKDNVAIIINDI